MSRCWLMIAMLAGLGAGLSAQERPTLKRAESVSAEAAAAGGVEADGDVQLPEEEDKNAVRPTEYAFNPVKSKREVTVGEFYFKKDNLKAAGERFTEATRWNAGNAQAWLRLGETAERQKDPKAARAAYEKYLELAADAKNAGEVKQRVERLKK